MPKALPARPSLEWLKKTAKQNLAALRADRPEAKLADAQRALARDYGFASWRALKAHVEGPPGEAEAAAFLRAVGDGEIGQGPRGAGGRSGARQRGRAASLLGRAAAAAPRRDRDEAPRHVRPPARRRRRRERPQRGIRPLVAADADLLARPGGHARGAARARRPDRPGRGAADEGRRAGRPSCCADGLPAVAPNGGSILAFARTPACDRPAARARRADRPEGPLGRHPDRGDEPVGAGRARSRPPHDAARHGAQPEHSRASATARRSPC